MKITINHTQYSADFVQTTRSAITASISDFHSYDDLIADCELQQKIATLTVDDSDFIGFQKLENILIDAPNHLARVTFSQIFNDTEALEELLGGRVSVAEAKAKRSEIEALASFADDETAEANAWAFPSWGMGVEYSIGDRVKFNDLLWKCVQDHVSQENWTPDQTPALWARTSTEEFPEWIQPTGAQDAYQKGDKVSHLEKHWISNLDANVWEPGVAGWDEQ